MTDQQKHLAEKNKIDVNDNLFKAIVEASEWSHAITVEEAKTLTYNELRMDKVVQIYIKYKDE